MSVWEYDFDMTRATTTSDAFNAVAEPRRREILQVLSAGELTVNELVERMQLAQPQVSKHLQVLRQVDLVRVRTVGRSRVYRVNGPPLKPIHDWVVGFEQHWNERFNRLDDYLGQLSQTPSPPQKETPS